LFLIRKADHKFVLLQDEYANKCTDKIGGIQEKEASIYSFHTAKQLQRLFWYCCLHWRYLHLQGSWPLLLIQGMATSYKFDFRHR